MSDNYEDFDVKMGNITGSNINIGGNNVKQAIHKHTQTDNIQTAFEIIYGTIQRMPDSSAKEDALVLQRKVAAG